MTDANMFNFSHVDAHSGKLPQVHRTDSFWSPARVKERSESEGMREEKFLIRQLEQRQRDVHSAFAGLDKATSAFLQLDATERRIIATTMSPSALRSVLAAFAAMVKATEDAGSPHEGAAQSSQGAAQSSPGGPASGAAGVRAAGDLRQPRRGARRSERGQRELLPAVAEW